MLNYKFNKKDRYVCACTYGQDSMALLDMMQKEGVKPIVCAINYHKFSNSDSDMAKLAEYCRERHLIFECLDTNNLPEMQKLQEDENWKDWARKVRYGFFKEVYEKYGASALFLAHQQDDLIETYLLRKQRQGSAAKHGLSPVSTIEGMMVVRPLLNYSKEDLHDYVVENHVPFNVSVEADMDESVRSTLRRDVISKMSEIERDQIIEEMKAANDQKFGLERSVATKINRETTEEELDIRALIALSKDAFASALVAFVQNAPEPINLTEADIANIRRLCLAPQPNMSIKLTEGIYLIKEYDVITMGHNLYDVPYTYTLDAPGKLSTPEFDLDFSMGAEDRHITADDYPLTIRTAMPYDGYLVHGYVEPVRRLFSDWKMPVDLRALWPIFINKDGKIIYVPRYRMKFREYHTSVLNIHVKDEYR